MAPEQYLASCCERPESTQGMDYNTEKRKAKHVWAMRNKVGGLNSFTCLVQLLVLEMNMVCCFHHPLVQVVVVYHLLLSPKVTAIKV